MDMHSIEKLLPNLDVKSQPDKSMESIMKCIETYFQLQCNLISTGYNIPIEEKYLKDFPLAMQTALIINKIYSSENFGCKFLLPENNHLLNKVIKIEACEPCGFLSKDGLDRITQICISKMQVPILSYVDQIDDLLQKIVLKIVQETAKFPDLRQKLEEMLTNFVEKQLKKCKENIKHLVNVEYATFEVDDEGLLAFRKKHEKRSSGMLSLFRKKKKIVNKFVFLLEDVDENLEYLRNVIRYPLMTTVENLRHNIPKMIVFDLFKTLHYYVINDLCPYFRQQRQIDSLLREINLDDEKLN